MIKPYCIGSDEWNGLSKLIEELGELQQVCGKLIGSQGESNHWSGDLHAKFIEELGDVYASLDFFVDMNFSPEVQKDIYKRAFIKYTTFCKWDHDVKAL
jgi:hypothetical protein